MSVGEEKVFQLCVVGAGLVGSAAARHASQNGHSVCLVGPSEPKGQAEWESREIFGSHYDEGRITRVWDSNVDLRVLNQASIQRYAELQRQSGIDFHSPVGCLFFGYKGADLITKFQREERRKSTTSNVLDLSDREFFKKRFPFLKCDVEESAYLESGGAGHISPRRLVEAQKTAATMNGCSIINEVVEEISYECLESKGILQVTTETGKVISCRRALLCTNAFTLLKPGLLPKADRQLNLRLRKTSAALIRISEEEAERLKTMPSLIYRGAKLEEDNPFSSYSLPPIKYPNGNWYLKIGLYTDEEEKLTDDDLNLTEMKKWFLSNGSQERVDLCLQFMKKLVPGLRVEGVERLCCVICHTPTGLPYIDNVTPELFVGLGGNGVSAKNSDELGRIAAVLASEDAWTSSIPKERFAIHWKKSVTN